MKPQLRFPEFTDEWREEKLRDIVERILDNRGKTPPVTSSGIPLLEINSIGSRSINYSKVQKFVTVETFNSWFRAYIEEGDILFSTVGQTALCSLYEGTKPSSIAQNIIGLRASEDINSNFLYYLLIQDRNNFKFKKIEMVAVQPSIKVSQMINLRFAIPSKPEQEKIASFLTAVDEKVELLGQKIEKLEEYKRGMMQKIFSQQIRFKDSTGATFPEWEEKKLGEIFYSTKGSSLSWSDIVDRGKNKAVLYGQLYTDYKEQIKNVISRTDSSKGTRSAVGYLLLPNSTTTSGIDLANATALNEEDVLLGGDITVLRFRNRGLNIYYAYYLSNFMKYKLAAYGQGSTIVHMYFSHYKNMRVMEPSYEEQRKIADFLTVIDEKITLTRQQLNKTQEFKKGLLQRMFV